MKISNFVRTNVIMLPQVYAPKSCFIKKYIYIKSLGLVGNCFQEQFSVFQNKKPEKHV